MSRLLLVAAFAIFAGAAMAQSERGVAIPPAVDAASKVTDALTFVNKAALSNTFEIRSSEIALEKSKDPKVLDFAKHMIADHLAATEKLGAAAASVGLTLTPPSEVDASHADDMDRLRGATTEFDTLYVRMQTAAHDEAIALFTAYSTKGDSEPLKSFAAETLPILVKHRQMLPK
jgi:putative membrane protein